MNKAEFVSAVAETAEMSKKDAAAAVDAVIETVTKALKNGDKIQLVGFGNFEVRARAARTGINPKTKEPIPIKASKVPAFKPGKALKDAIN